MLTVTQAWKAAYPGAAVGVLAMHGVANPKHHPGLDARKKELESHLRTQLAGGDRSTLRALEPIQAYNTYYRRFKKTYHVQLQLESVAFKGRPIPSISSLVEAMFMSEIKNLLLTAGHDLDAIEPPVTLDVSGGDELYTLLSGKEQALRAGDMMISDAQGVISSVVYGPDRRTRFRPDTRRALFTVYAPDGIGGDAVRKHLADVQANVSLISPEARTESIDVYAAD